MEIIDTVKWQDCLECYWQHFHPLFPIVHRPTFFATKPSPLMAGAMVAIGSQYDTRPNAKEYSLALLEACWKLLAKRPAITSRSRVTDIQTVFLLEYLSKFRSRKADVQISHRFRSLYGSFMQDRHWVHVNPLAVLNTLPQDCSQDALRRAQKFWVEHEARRRVLQAAFILDIQQSLLFGQPSVSLQPSSAPFNMWPQVSQTTNIPFPCNSDLWESRDLDDWLTLARAYVSLSLPSAAVSINRLQGLQSDHFDHFQALLLLAYNLSLRAGPGDDNSILNDPLSTLVAALQDGNMDDPTASPHSQSLFSYHTLMAARYAPLHTLLTVSGESWLFNQKLAQEGEFRSAKVKLRQWVSDTDDVKKAVWHAVRALRYVVGNTVWQSSTTASTVSTNTQWNTSNMLPTTPLVTDPSNMLQTNWSIYICVLICWAYGFETNNIPSQDGLGETQATETRAYIYNMISLTPTWRHVSQANILSSVRCNIYPLLQHIRMTRLQEGRIGGLLNEANRVLARLSEPRFAHGEIRGMWSF
jgi:Fungal specific transcription factor domain